MNKIIYLILIINYYLITCCSTRSQNNTLGGENIFDHDKTTIINNFTDTQSSILRGFDCDKFHYNLDKRYSVDKNGFPTLSRKDSNDLINYAIHSGQIKYAINRKDTTLWRLLYLLPRIRSIINKQWYDKIINANDSLRLNGLKKSYVYDLIESDAVVLGEVVETRYVRDSTKCFYYKTEYAVKVNEVLHSYFKLDKNTVVLLKSMTGFAGGCNPKNPKVYDSTDHIRDFKNGDKWIFFLKHNEYYSKFLFKINNSISQFDDQYCSHAFQMYNGNCLYNFNNDLLISNIRAFLNDVFIK